MPTKRTKISRTAVLVTPGSVELYRTGLRTQPCWDACHDACTIDCTHTECAEYYEAFHALNMAFSIPPHQPSPMYSYEHIRGYPDNERSTLIKQALDAALAADDE
jgi:hypothetical protein